MVRACARLHPNLGSRRHTPLQLPQPLPPAQLPLPYRLVVPIDPVQLKHILCHVHANSHNLHLGFLLTPDW
jgi:hypothetical protein